MPTPPPACGLRPGTPSAEGSGRLAENAAGKRKIYQQRPTGAHFPFLPAFEFFDRKLFPWFDELESYTDVMREELLALWAADDLSFRPYVARHPHH